MMGKKSRSDVQDCAENLFDKAGAQGDRGQGWTNQHDCLAYVSGMPCAVWCCKVESISWPRTVYALSVQIGQSYNVYTSSVGTKRRDKKCTAQSQSQRAFPEAAPYLSSESKYRTRNTNYISFPPIPHEFPHSFVNTSTMLSDSRCLALHA